jgi:hypothetical protein
MPFKGKNDNSDDQALGQEAGGENGSGGDASEPKVVASRRS